MAHQAPQRSTGSASGSQNRRRQRRILIGGAGVALAIVLITASWVLLMRAEQSSGADASELARFEGHKAAVRALAISADGELAVSGDQAGRLLVWNTKNRAVRGQLPAGSTSVDCVAVSLDGKLAASGDEAGKIQVWNLERLVQQASTVGHRGAVTSLVMYSAKTHLLSGGRDGRIVLWKLSEHGDQCEASQQASLDSAEVTCLAITPDGLHFVCGDTSGGLTLWDLAGVRQVKRFAAHKGAVRGVAVSPLGAQAITCGDDGQVRRWDLERGRMVVEGRPAGEPVPQWAIAFSPGGTRALSTDGRGTLHLWSVDAMQEIESYAGHTAGASSVAFFPSGSVALSGSRDQSVRIWQMPMPSVLEAKQTAEAIDAVRRRVERLQKFRRQMELGEQALHDGRAKAALAEFRTAETSVDRGSLEFQAAHQVADELAAEMQSLEDYQRLCKAGADALEKEDFDKAKDDFQQARKAIAGRKNAATLHQADEGYAAAVKLGQLKQALDGRKITYQNLTFAKLAPAQHALDTGKQFAFLLTSEDPPMALASSPLKWTIEMHTPVAFPDEKVDFKVQVWQQAGKVPMAEVRHPFVVGRTEQSFVGQATPPPDGWPSGEYQLRISVATRKKDIPREPIDFKLGRLDWTETQIELTPDAVQDANYAVETDVKLERGDAVIVKATGKMTPAPTAFYRQLLVDPKIAAGIPSGPTGIAWKADGLRVNNHRLIDLKFNFAALLMRIGYAGMWLPYREDVFPLLAPQTGPVHLSLNSVLPLNYSAAHAVKNITASERSYWAAGSGAYQVTILHGRYDFPIKLTFIQRAGLLIHFSDR
jgi:hypothetical protein